jgi:DNA modification methylase
MAASRMNNLTGKQWLQNSFTVWRDIRKTLEEKKLKHPAMFPQELVEKLIDIYTKDPGEVVLDPFLGSGSTILAALNKERKGIGIDLSDEYIELTKARVNNFQTGLLSKNRFYDPFIIKDDANNLLKHVKPESVDLVVTYPPYWDILNMKRTADKKMARNYSDSDQDIGNAHDYEQFMKELKKIYTEVYKSMKYNKRCICVVMDIRKKDKFYPFHIDQTKIMQEIGFELEEFVIWDRQHEYNNMKTLGYPWVFRFNKVHEYICIYWKR